MCVDPISLTAIGATIFGAVTSGAAAAGGAAGLTLGTAAAAGAGTASLSAVTALTVGSGLLSGIGTLMTAQGQAASAKANANAALAAGYSQEEQYRLDARQKMATQFATLSTRGINLSTGSPLQLMAESAKNAELDALTIRANAGNTAAGYRAQARAALIAGPISAAGQFLTSGVKLAELGKI